MGTAEKKQRLLSKTLDRLKLKEHLPQDLLHLLGQIAGLQLEAAGGITLALPELDLVALNRKVVQGGTFLTPETLPVDKAQAFELFSKITALIAEQAERMPEAMFKAVAHIVAGIEAKELDLEKAVDECLSGEGPILKAWAERTPDAPGALRFLLLASIAPSLSVAVKMLMERLDDAGIESGIRQTGTCPVCGNLPYMLELRETEGFRFAACSMCRHEYRIRRMPCTVCDNNDPEKLKFFTVEEEPGFRVETCGNCNTYMKTIDFRALDRDAYPALNDLESLTLDFLAAEQGFTRSTLSVWGI